MWDSTPLRFLQRAHDALPALHASAFESSRSASAVRLQGTSRTTGHEAVAHSAVLLFVPGLAERGAAAEEEREQREEGEEQLACDARRSDAIIGPPPRGGRRAKRKRTPEATLRLFYVLPTVL